MTHSYRQKAARTPLILAVFSLLAWPMGASAGEASASGIGALFKWLPLILQGFAVDVGISVVAMIFGTLLGTLLGICQISQLAAIRTTASLITQFFRNSPWLVLLFFCVLLLPYYVNFLHWTFVFPSWAKGIIGLMLPVMGYVSEIVRGGIQSIPSGQWEAADALALSRGKTLRMIILPQAIKRMAPPWMNVYAILMMSTPLVSIVGVEDSVTVARSVLSAENNTALLMPVYGLILFLFFAYCYPIARWTRKLERRYAVA